MPRPHTDFDQRLGMPSRLSRPTAGVIQYGRRFAQTAELYTAHEMEHQLEELVRLDKKPKAKRAPRKKAAAAKTSKSKRTTPRAKR
jgi:hypothetical protein